MGIRFSELRSPQTGAAYGRRASVLMEACKHIPGLRGEPLGRSAGNE